MNFIPCWLQLNFLQLFSEREDNTQHRICGTMHKLSICWLKILCYLPYNKAPVSETCFSSTEVFHNFVGLSGLWLSCCEITETAYFVASFVLSFPPSTCKGNQITLHLLSAKLNSCRAAIMFPMASMLLSTSDKTEVFL